MRINKSSVFQNNFLSVGYANRDLQQNGAVQKDGGQEKNSSVFVTISPLGKIMSTIEALTKQKENLNESKNALIAKTLEDGGELEDIETQLEYFDEQLDNIDMQIVQARAEYMRLQSEKQKKKSREAAEKEQDAQTDPTHSIISLSSRLEQVKRDSALKTKMDEKAPVLERQIAYDRSRGAATEVKKEELADIRKRSIDLNNQIHRGLSEINREAQESRERHSWEPEDAEEREEGRLQQNGAEPV